MPTIDLLCDGVVSQTFAVTIARAYADDTNIAEALLGQVAISTLDDLPAEAHTVTSAQVFYRGGVNAGKSTVSVDVKLLDSSGTMLVEEANNLSDTDLTTLSNTGVATTTTAGDFTPAMVNDMRLQMKHAGNVSGTPVLQLEFIFVRVVYAVAPAVVETYDSSANNIHCTLGNIHVKSGNILL